MSWGAVAHVLGRLLLVLGGAVLVPAVVSLVHGEWGATTAFLATAVATAGAGALLAWVGRARGELYRREGILVVVGGWALASLFGALPYLATGTFVNPADALFESASGFTTTGASVLTEIETQGRGVLFWRCFTQWLGGMGIIVLFVALLPELGPGARFLYKLEVPGPTAETLTPRVRDTALSLWKIYLLFTVAQTVLLLAGGLDLYDALTHTFSTLSTGGFSPRNASVAAYESPFVHLVITAFMIIAGANFSLYYGIARHRGTNLWRDVEFRVYLGFLAVATFVVAVDLVWRGSYGLRPARALLDALFQVASIMTTTGFATADFDLWPGLSKVVLVLLMFVGASAGSTSGALKVMRVVVGLKSAAREVRLIFSPNSVSRVFVGGSPVPEGVVRSVSGFVILFIAAWAFGAVVLALGGLDPMSAVSGSIAILGNVGPGLGEVGPAANFASIGTPEKLVMVLLMWLGRLEVYALAALFVPRFWRA